MSTRFASLALLLLLPLESMAFDTARDVLATCRATGAGEARADAAKYRACSEYLLSTVNVAVEYSMAIPASCVPYGMSAERLRQVWLRYARANPQRLDFAATGVVRDAFGDEWPCDNR